MSATNPPPWYHRAVFYEVLVRSFSDSNDDGVGDLRGLIDKLDYLEWLGVDALWLPPFYQSPLRDGGYDVADYREVLPAFGTLDDFRELVDKAHQRGMRVVIDLVANHTSNLHPWFQASRSDPQGPYGDYYVWSDTDTRWPNIRIIFTDTEISNWAYDEARGQYYFHRFFSHQPDLNYANPKVVAEIMEVARFWLAHGVDGFRLDAVPYLYESDGGVGESEPETHEVIRTIRAMLDAEYPEAVLIAEANQDPPDVAQYFGSDDAPECHMAFDFPVMPRIFHALRSGIARPLARLLSEGTEIPSFARWALFLRNHDELSLEMVSDQEREELYAWYAPEPRMRVNVGIRRRLASLLEGSREKLEFVHALLLALPGTPFLYYGDEIAMGDNIWLDDRDASRTPMQWDATANGGFSRAPSGALTLPVVDASPFSYRDVNVQASLDNDTSLLHFLRGLIAIRKSLPALIEGSVQVMRPQHTGTLALLRCVDSTGERPTGSPPVLALYSFAPHAVRETLQLPAAYAHCTLREAISGMKVNLDEQARCELDLGAWGFGWWVVEAAHELEGSG